MCCDSQRGLAWPCLVSEEPGKVAGAGFGGMQKLVRICLLVEALV